MKLFKKILVALVSAALISTSFAASALTLGGVESAEEYVPTVVDEDGLTDTEYLKQQASAHYSEEYMEAFEEMAAWELTASNLRNVIDFFGLTESFGRDYAIDEELLGYFPNFTMEDIVWNLASVADTNLMSMDHGFDKDFAEYTNLSTATREIKVFSTSLEETNYKIEYKGATISQTATYNEESDLKITPNDGYEISFIYISKGSYYAGNGKWFDGVNADNADPSLLYPNDNDYFTMEADGSIIFQASLFDQVGTVTEGNYSVGFYPFVVKNRGSTSATVEFKVATKVKEKELAGPITIIEDGGTGALYSLTSTNGTISSNVNKDALQDDIDFARTNQKSINVGDTLRFTFDASKISGVKVNGTPKTLSSSSFTEVATKERMDITFIYKSKAEFSMSDGSVSGAYYRVETRRAGAEGYSTVLPSGSAAKVQETLNKQYNEGDEVTLTITVPSGRKLTTVTYDLPGASDPTPLLSDDNDDNSVSFKIIDKAILTVSFVEIKPILTINEYKSIKNTNPDGATDNDVFVLAKIDNYQELTDNKISNAYFKIKVVGDNGNPNINDYNDRTVSGGRVGAYFAMGFMPKAEDGTGYHFDTTFTVTAHVKYAGIAEEITEACTIMLKKRDTTSAE